MFVVALHTLIKFPCQTLSFTSSGNLIAFSHLKQQQQRRDLINLTIMLGKNYSNACFLLSSFRCFNNNSNNPNNIQNVNKCQKTSKCTLNKMQQNRNVKSLKTNRIEPNCENVNFTLGQGTRPRGAAKQCLNNNC